MGNCIQRKQAKEMHEHQQKQEDHDQSQRDETAEIKSGFVKERSSGEKGNLRLKIVVTKEELEWLMVQLKNKGGIRSLEDALGEIEKGRSKLVEGSWRPSLESIMECPEVVEMDR